MTPTGNTSQPKDVQVILRVSKGPATPSQPTQVAIPPNLIAMTVKKATQTLNEVSRAALTISRPFSTPQAPPGARRERC